MHFLIQRARAHAVTEPMVPETAIYDVAAGVWRTRAEPSRLLVELEPEARPKMMSKKADVEKGEDRKGR